MIEVTLHFYLTAIGYGGELDDSVKGDLNIRHPLLLYLQEVSQETPQYSLMTNNHHVLLPLQLHDDGLHPRHQVLVTLAVGIPAKENYKIFLTTNKYFTIL